MHAFVLDPMTRRGFLAIDGESVPLEPVVCEVFPALARLIMPPESRQSQTPPRSPQLPSSVVSSQ